MRSLRTDKDHEGEAVLMGGRAASKKPARTEAGKAEGGRERDFFPAPLFLEELTHGELEPSAGAVTLDVLVQREAVGEGLFAVYSYDRTLKE